MADADPWAAFPVLQAAPDPQGSAASDPWAAFPIVQAAPQAAATGSLDPRVLTITPASADSTMDPEGTGQANYDTGPSDPNAAPDLAVMGANGASLGLAPRIAAAGDTAINAIRGAVGASPMDGTAPDYAANLDRYRNLVAGAEVRHPYEAPLVEGMAGLATPLGVAGDVLKGATVAGKIVRGAAAGAGLGSIQGAASAPDWSDVGNTAASIVGGAKTGAQVGATLPAAGAALGGMYGMAAPFFSAPIAGTSRATTGIISNLLTPRAQAAMDKLGPQAVLADASPSLTGLAGGVVTKPGAGADTLVDALTNRAKGQSDRLMADRYDALGPAMSPLEFKNAMDAKKAATGPMYDAALSNMGPVDISPVVAQVGLGLNRAVGPERNALAELKSWMMQDAVPPGGGQPVPQPISDPVMVQKVKQAADDRINYEASPFAQQTSAVKSAQGAYQTARAGLNDVLQQASPDYANANAAFNAAAKTQRAFDTGREALANADEWPRDLSARFQGMPLEQQAGERAGVRSNIEQQFGTNRSDLNVLAKLLGDGNDFNREKLGTYFGEDSRDSLVNALTREKTFADTTNKVVQNSQSAQRLGGSKLIDDEDDPKKMIPQGSTWTGLAGGLAEAGLRKLASSTGGKTRDELGRILSLSGPDYRTFVAGAQSNAGYQAQNAKMLAELLTDPATTRALLAGQRGRQTQTGSP